MDYSSRKQLVETARNKNLNFREKIILFKEFLRGKEIVLTIIGQTESSEERFKTLKSFGERIIELEKLGFNTCSFNGVKNTVCERGIIRNKDFIRCLDGVWDKVYITTANRKF